MQNGRGLALPHALCALCLQSTLAASLRQLLLNDSLLDIGSRRALYLELIQLLKCLGESNQQSASCHAWQSYYISVIRQEQNYNNWPKAALD